MLRSNYNYKALILEVKDGDTFTCLAIQADLGFGDWITKKIELRLKDIDTPEIFKPRNEWELKHGLEAKARAVELIDRAWCWIRTTQMPKAKREKTSIGHRYEAQLWVPPDRFEGIDNIPTVIMEDGSVGMELTWILKMEGFEKRERYDGPQ